MATATATKTETTYNGASTHDAKPEVIKVEAELTSGIFKGKMVDLTISSDGQVTHMSDPKLTPEERKAWDEMMSVCRQAVESARELREQNVESVKLMKQLQQSLKGETT